ncbi:hypothetical protein Agabi119p4_261 [Agaricus bisporus var. burnettii]|uniref:DUF6593 domain-containing protein n=1 Tax=Agaricus bisporus var. burnettii TaxID=192524 RepID=A0A8H7FAF2_AGABI|nr:hypothetical protein Agabi119p4_261 [Agaricus bisporus var. burnettii]
MIILNESESFKSESLKSDSFSSFSTLEPPPRHGAHSLISSPNFSTISLNQHTTLSQSSRDTPFKRSSLPTPPGYLESNRPATSVTYTFAPQMSPPNSMILSAPAYTSQEPYYISVNMNCFTPSSYITTIRRKSWEGDTIGDFEMGLTTSKKQSVVFTRGREYALSDILETNYRLIKTTWSWKVMDQKQTVIYWDDAAGNGMLTCFSSKDRVQGNLLAKFTPPSLPRKQGKAPEHTRLEVLPLGFDFIDDVVISSLVIERLRTTPTVPRVPLT